MEPRNAAKGLNAQGGLPGNCPAPAASNAAAERPCAALNLRVSLTSPALREAAEVRPLADGNGIARYQSETFLKFTPLDNT